MSRSFKLAKKKAVSIMELSVVLAVLGLLVVGFSSYQALRKTAEVNSLVETSQNLAKAIITYSSTRGALPGDVNNDRYIMWGSSEIVGVSPDNINLLNESLKAYKDLASQNLISMDTNAGSFGVMADVIISGSGKNVISTKIPGVGITIVSFSSTSTKYYAFNNMSSSFTLVIGSKNNLWGTYEQSDIAGAASWINVSSSKTTNGEGVPVNIATTMDKKIDSETGSSIGDVKYSPTSTANTVVGYLVRL